MQERRNDNRMLCAELVELIYRDGAGYNRRGVVNLDDISRSGVCVQLDVRIPDGTRVDIRYRGGELAGVVRYCASRDGSYFLGIEFSENSRWSPTEFIPDHLLDPRQLVENAVNRIVQ